MCVRHDHVSVRDKTGALTMRANLLILLFLSLVLVVPAVATDVSFTAPATQAISYIDVYAPVGSTGSIYVTQEDGNSTLFTWSYLPFTNLIGGQGAVALTSTSGDSSSYIYQTSGNLHLQIQVWGLTPASPITPQIKLASAQSGLLWNKIIAATTSRSPVLSYRVISDQSVTVSQTLEDYDKAVAAVSDLEQSGINAVNYLISLVGSFVDFITQLFYWIKYFFVDNLAMIVALFLAVPMAFAAKNSRGNPEKFLRQYFKTLKGFFGFIVWLWTALIRTAAYIRGMFKIV